MDDKALQKFSIQKNEFIYGINAFVIDSFRFDLNRIVSFEISEENKLFLISNDPGIIYERNMDQDLMDHLDKVRDRITMYHGIRVIDHALLNEKAPDFQSPTLSGNQFNLNGERGKIVHLNFWFLGCIPCLKEIPKINQLKKDFPEIDFISVTPDSLGRIRKYIYHLGASKYKIEKPYTFFGNEIDFDIITDGQDIINRYQFYGYPISFLINEEGCIEHVLRHSESYYDNTTVLLNEMLGKLM